MLKLGTKCIKNLKLGDKTIFKGIKGGKTVYRNYPIFLDYIVFDGESYINPNINTFGTWNVTAQGADVRLQFLLGNSGGGAGNWFGITASGYWGVGANHYFDIPYTEKMTASVTFSSTGVTATIDDTTIFREGKNDINRNYYLCSHTATVSSYHFKGKVYGCSFTDTNGVLTLDLRPAIDPCGIVCMYDMVTNKYFYNQGTGELVAGGRFVESIVFDGKSWINTGIAYQTCTVKTAVKYEANKGQRMLSGFSGYGTYWGMTVDGLLELNNGSGAGTDLTDYTEVEFKVDLTNMKLYCTADGVTLQRYSLEETETYKIGSVGKYSANKVIGNVYCHRAYNATGELIQDLRPYVDENGVACFKDVVTDTLFYNQGTGTLTYIDFERIPYLESDGTNYIDTGLKGNSNYTYKLDIKFNEILNSSCFGMRNQASATGGPIFAITYAVMDLNDYICFYISPTSGASANKWQVEIMQVDKRYDIYVAPSKAIYRVNGQDALRTLRVSDFITDYNMYLFAQNLAGSVGVPQKLKVYGYTVQDENCNYIQEFIPVKRSDGVKCLYDRVENKYYELKVA